MRYNCSGIVLSKTQAAYHKKLVPLAMVVSVHNDGCYMFYRIIEYSTTTETENYMQLNVKQIT